MPTINFKPPYNDQVQMLMLPHLVFSQIFHEYKKGWEQFIVPSQEKLQEFWKLQEKHPAFPAHPVLSAKSNFATSMVPLALHGDGTPVIGIGKQWSRQLTTFSWNSLLGVGNSKSLQMQVWSVFDETMSQTTLKQFWEILCWSLKWLQLGLFPDEDHLGNKFPASSVDGRRALQPLAGGFCGILWCLVGDLEYLTQVLKLPHYSSKKNPCALCRCTGDAQPNSWKDCRLTAEWLGLQWKPSQWMEWVDKSPCGLFQHLPGCTAVAVAYDFMHSKYLGTDMVFIGSCLWLLCHKILPKTALENLQTCWVCINEVYKAQQIVSRYRGMNKLTLFQRKKGGPKIKGRAAQVASLAEPLFVLWGRHMDATNLLHKKIKTWLKLNMLTERILKENAQNLALEPDECQTFKSMSFAMAQLHRDLAQSFLGKEETTLFADIPKLHTWLHSVLASEYLNPRLTWCFRQEDYMGVQRCLARSSCRGLKGPQVTAKIISKVRVAMHIQLTKE